MLTAEEFSLFRNLVSVKEQVRRRMIDEFYRSLNPGGYLFLGHSESLHGFDARFAIVSANKGTAYQKPEMEIS